jgi:hypothetical protein
MNAYLLVGVVFDLVEIYASFSESSLFVSYYSKVSANSVHCQSKSKTFSLFLGIEVRVKDLRRKKRLVQLLFLERG